MSVTPELMQDIGAAFNSRDLDRIMAFFAEDCTFCAAAGPEPAGRAIKGKAAVREALAAVYGSMPDLSFARDYEFASGDRAVTAWRMTGKTADGKTIDVQGCDLWEFRDGLIVKKDTYLKTVRRA
ncbi:nuclear transport factor 2 family protein [Rhodovarius crocodyli]|nr:nuclear transport factor 2 family protein [Rhodovarius crocodyli]